MQKIFHSFSVSVKASVEYAAAAFVLSTESDSRGAAAALLRLLVLLLRSSQFLAEPRTVPSPRGGQECVHLPDRGGCRCLELHGDSGKVWGRILEMEERDVNERVVEVADQERGHNEEEVMIIMVNVA